MGVKEQGNANVTEWSAAMWNAHFIEQSGKDETNSLLAKTVADLWVKVDFLFDERQRALWVNSGTNAKLASLRDAGSAFADFVPESRCEAHVADLFVELNDVEGRLTSTMSAHHTIHEEMSKTIESLDGATQSSFEKVAEDIRALANGQVQDERQLESRALVKGPHYGEVEREQTRKLISSRACDVVLKGSTWDAVLLLGLEPDFNRVASIGVFMACVTSVIIQLVLCGVFVQYNRSFISRRYAFFDAVTTWAAAESPTTVGRLCVGDLTLGTYHRQFQLVSAYATYNLGLSESLSMVCLVIWLLSVMNVVLRIEDVRSAVWCLHQTKTEVVLRLHRYSLLSFSRGRVMFSTCVLLLRLIIVLLLAVLGLDILSISVDPWDMVLKVVVLNFTLHFDEESYLAFVPAQYKIVVSQTNPMKVRSIRGPQQAVLLIFFGLCAVVSFSLLTSPRIESFKGTVKEMCSYASV